MKIVILDAKTMGEDIDFSPISNIGETVIYERTSPEEISGRIKDADVVCLNKVVLNEEVLKKANNLMLICLFAIGFNNVDTCYCKTRGIKVRNVPGYCVESVCQHAFTILFSLMENIRYYDEFVRSGKYEESGIANHLGRPFEEIAGKRWGILGMGAIGRRIASVANAFGAKVNYASLSGVKREEEFEEVSFNELISQSDIICLCAPLNEKTYKIIGENELKSMKDTAIIINVGRGALTDEYALARALDNGEIGGAAIDVYENEPPIGSPLLNVKNKEKILYTPHIAWSSVQARKRCVEMVADNIKAFIRNESSNDVI